MYKSDNILFFKKCKQVTWELFMNRSLYILYIFWLYFLVVTNGYLMNMYLL